MITFQASYDLDLKNKVVSGYAWTPKIFLDFNPNSYGVDLILFWPPDFLDEDFPGLVWPWLQKQSC